VGEILDGKAIAEVLRTKIATRVAQFAAHTGRKPGLDVILVGENPASAVYVRNKAKACEAAGMRGTLHKLSADTAQAALLTLIAKLNADESVDGILVQLPLPKHIHADEVLDAVSPSKDVDGFHPINAGLLLEGRGGLVPCTPWGCMRLVEHTGRSLEGARAVVVGRSNIVGKPAALLLLQRNATVTIAHSKTEDLAAVCATADVLVAAVGRAEMIRGAWIKPGAIVLDVGINRNDTGQLVGDVCFAEAKEVAGWITPVPGGVGPMTIACLLENTLGAAWRRAGLPTSELVI
jgi:methylenetetrahydrofolate dehydrogenase (NADP+)/methenyltetrahydrofolate cyclohydrolase